MFCVLKVRRKGRTEVNQRFFQVLTLCIWNQGRVQRIQNGLMISHFVVNVGLVEVFPFETFQFGDPPMSDYLSRHRFELRTARPGS
jgi:hypothetical protein